MRKGLLGAGLLILLPLPAMAQDAPKAEVFGGYSYFRARDPIGINLHGWNASVTGNLNNWLGVTADFGGHYGGPSVFGFRPPGLDTNLHSFLFGPTVYGRTQSSLLPFGHALFGFGRGQADAFGFSLSDRAFAMALGGGVDYGLNDSVAIRLIQADYVQTRFLIGKQHHARLSAGIVFRLGVE